MESINEEYLIIIDMPGQIELYTHIPIVPALIKHLSRNGQLQINLCAAYLLESTFIVDRAKFFSGTLSAMSAMIMLELPHVNILSKMDLVKGMVGRRELRKFVDPDADLLLEEEKMGGNEETSVADPTKKDAIMSGGSFKALNQAVAKLIDDFSMVSFLQLDVTDEDSIGGVLSYIDDAIQFHEAQEPKEPNDELVEQPWEDNHDEDME
jgi:GPN-loop GTPase